MMESTAVSQEQMGKFVVSLTLTNWVDQVLAERGFIAADEVRALTIDNALVDTGATRLCLPADVYGSLVLSCPPRYRPKPL
ncbi:MAG: hypothetical protein AAFY78_20210 [Cyanobacteria bacterium J06648_16]